MDNYIGGRLGMIFDTTSSDANKIKKYKKLLDAIGYESKMVYVNTSLDNAQKRNESRPRKLPPEIVQRLGKSTKESATFRSIFKKDFLEVVNDDDLLMKKAKKL